VTVVSSAIAHFVALWLPPLPCCTWLCHLRGSVPPPYMEPMFGLCWSMLGSWRLLSLCWAKNGVFLFNPLPGPKGTLRFWIMSGACWAYMEPMLGLCWSMSVRLLEAILGPYLSHVELMLSQERRVPFKSSNFEGATRWKFAAVGYRFPPRSGFSRVS